MGMAWREWEGMKTLHFSISHPEQASKPVVVHILLEERPVLEKSDPV